VELELAEELRATLGRLVRSVREVNDLPRTEAAALGLLDREGPHTTAQLAQRHGVRHQTMAQAVARLAAEGMIEKAPHATDGRMTLLTITPAGVAATNADRRRRADWLAAAIDAELDETERADLARCVPLLARLAAHRLDLREGKI